MFMNISLIIPRIIFSMICAIVFTFFAMQQMEFNSLGPLVGLVCGISFSFFVFGIEFAFKKSSLRTFNLTILGLFVGYLMGIVLTSIFKASLFMISPSLVVSVGSLLPIAVFLVCLYLGVITTIKASNQICFSIPFFKFNAQNPLKKDILLDSSILTDTRIIDLATSGLLDHHVILPRFILNELYLQSESHDEQSKIKAKKSLEVVKKLEEIPHLHLQHIDFDFPETKDIISKLTRLARHLDANIITADISRVQQSNVEGLQIININLLSNALKPVATTGEFITIKIQRFGKEAGQGIGYLDNGTMVVVNGGGSYLGETVKAQVLSVKHTSSGKMVFCNAFDEMSEDDPSFFVSQFEDLERNSKPTLVTSSQLT